MAIKLRPRLLQQVSRQAPQFECWQFPAIPQAYPLAFPLLRLSRP